MAPLDGALRVSLVVETYVDGAWKQKRESLVVANADDVVNIMAVIDYVKALRRLPRPATGESF